VGEEKRRRGRPRKRPVYQGPPRPPHRPALYGRAMAEAVYVRLPAGTLERIRQVLAADHRGPRKAGGPAAWVRELVLAALDGEPKDRE